MSTPKPESTHIFTDSVEFIQHPTTKVNFDDQKMWCPLCPLLVPSGFLSAHAWDEHMAPAYTIVPKGSEKNGSRNQLRPSNP